ncbi:hypothetical protein [Candidatus Thiosymbion oneisti]|uniref:hypothetical protein n=1 Tax=Candidatus Thiosymbion oneisti TaxID=589554 RepID=UPI00114D3814|nr:hypothetical protein [Candidatus Thiosymbion oneisti]
MKHNESFGFLKYPQSIDFEGGRIMLAEEYEDGLQYIKENLNRDGFMYPPLVMTVELNLNTLKPEKYIPHTERPASVFSLPKSHDLYIENPIGCDDLRFEDAGFLMHNLGFFFGTRLQFIDWMFDGKVPIESKNSFVYADDVPPHYLSFTYQKWREWNKELRKRFVNILYICMEEQKAVIGNGIHLYTNI